MNARHLIAAIVLALASEPWMATAQEPAWVTAKQLLATPQEFDGKRISVLGYYVDNFDDGSRLFAGRKPAKSSKGSRKNIWIDQTTSLILAGVTLRARYQGFRRFAILRIGTFGLWELFVVSRQQNPFSHPMKALRSEPIVASAGADYGRPRLRILCTFERREDLRAIRSDRVACSIGNEKVSNPQE